MDLFEFCEYLPCSLRLCPQGRWAVKLFLLYFFVLCPAVSSQFANCKPMAQGEASQRQVYGLVASFNAFYLMHLPN